MADETGGKELRAERDLRAANEALERKTLELAASVAQMQATLEATTDAIVVTTTAGRVAHYNTKYLEIWQIPREVAELRDHWQILALVAEQTVNPQEFRRRVDDIYAMAPAETLDVLQLRNGRVLERYSRTQLMGERDIGRVWSFRDVTARLRADEQLREQREWFRVTLSSIGDAVIATDTKGRITFLNAIAETMTGWSAADAVGRPLEVVFRIINESTRAPAENPVAKVLRDGLIVGLANHTALLSRDGRETPIDDSAAPIRDSGGAITGVVMVFHDVSERRRADRALEDETRVLELLNTTGRAIAAELDMQKLLQIVTDAGTALSGAKFGAFFYNVKDPNGGVLQLYTLSGAPREAFDKMGHPRATAIFGPTMRGEEPMRIDDVLKDPRYGQMPPHHGMPKMHLPVRSYLAVPVVSRLGEVFGGLFFGHPEPGVFTERAERLIVGVAAQAAIAIDNARLFERSQRELEQERRAEEVSRRLAAIVESSDDAIIAMTLEGVITDWNAGAARMFGFAADEVVGKSILMLLPTERHGEEPEILERIARGERIEHYETVRQRKDGTTFDVSLSVSAIKDPTQHGSIVGVSKIARDISDRKRAKEALERLVQERTASLREAISQMEEFSYSVSHDLRSPARAMSGYADVLLEDYGDRLDENGRELLRRIQRNAARMDQLIRDLLTYSRLNQRELQFTPVNVEKLIHEVTDQYPELRAVREHIVLEGPLPEVLAHEPSLTQVISNLLNNAVKFVKPGETPHVTVRGEVHGDRMRILVSDRGIGVKAEYQSRLFGLFERIHPEQQYAGTGIGLAIVRKAMDRMNGKAGVESDGVSGSTFWIELPLAT